MMAQMNVIYEISGWSNSRLKNWIGQSDMAINYEAGEDLS